MIYEIASVASLLRNDIPTQPQMGEGREGGEICHRDFHYHLVISGGTGTQPGAAN